MLFELLLDGLQRLGNLRNFRPGLSVAEPLAAEAIKLHTVLLALACKPGEFQIDVDVLEHGKLLSPGHLIAGLNVYFFQPAAFRHVYVNRYGVARLNLQRADNAVRQRH